MTSPDPDLEAIVVGAGPAGASAAFHLARSGRRVLLLEGLAKGRSKSCGGGMAASVQRWFPFDLSPVVDQVIHEVRFTWCLKDPVTALLPGDSPFWIVRRTLLDGFLTTQAHDAGAEVRFESPVDGIVRHNGLWSVNLRGGECLLTRAVVIADGSASRLATSLGLGSPRPRYAATVAVEVDAVVNEPETARFEFGLVPHGFCWCFPRQGGYNIGVGTFIGREEADSEAVLTTLLPSLGLQPKQGERQSGRLRIWNGHHPLHGDGLVAVGDAASLSDPFLAEGLRPSLMSGTYGADAIDRWLGGDINALAKYSLKMRHDWGESMAWGRRIAQVFYRVPKVGYQLGVKRPTAPQRIAQILSGEMSYGDIAQRVIRRLIFQRK